MSAYMMDRDKLLAIAVWAARERGRIPETKQVTHRAAELYRLNVRSLQARYPGDNSHGLRHDMVGYGEGELLAAITDGTIFAAMELPAVLIEQITREARYQSCEFDGWELEGGARVLVDASHEAVTGLLAQLGVERGAGWAGLELIDSGAVRLSSMFANRD